MTDSHDIDERLRAALGADGPLGTGGPRKGTDAAAARTRVLAGLRQRRLHRLQALGAAAVVVIGLGVVLPQVFNAAATSTPRAAKSAKPNTHGAMAAGGTVAGASSATCRASTRTVAVCGHVARGSAAEHMSATAAAAPPMYSNAALSPSYGHLLTVRAGSTIVVRLPRLKKDWWWATPKIAGTAVYHGSGPPVVVRDEGSQASTQRFLVETKAPVTVVLEAKEDVFSGRGTGAWTGAGPAPVWALELKVEGR